MTVDLLSSLMSVVAVLATYFIHSTLLIGGVWVLLRLRPSLGNSAREVLWKTALVGGIVTTVAQMLPLRAPLSGDMEFRLPLPGFVAGTPRATEAKPALSVVSTEASPPSRVATSPEVQLIFLESEFDGRVEHVPAMQLDERLAGKSADEPQAHLPTSAFDLHSLLSTHAGWFVGLAAIVGSAMLWGAGRYFVQFLVLQGRLTGAAEMTEGTARRLLDDLLRYVPRGRRVRLLSGPNCSEPIAYGLVRWTIVLPVRAEYELSPAELQSLLAHELAHLVRGDTWWLLVCRLVCSFAGFQPLNHFAWREWQRAAEYLCDAWAVDRTGDRLALARCLTEVAGWRWQSADCSMSLAATGRRRGLADRIERLIDEETRRDPAVDRRLRARLIGIAGVVIVLLVGAGPRVRLAAALSHSASEEALVGERSEPAMAGGPVPEGRPPVTSAQLLAELDAELLALASEIEALAPLWRKPTVSAEARERGERLQALWARMHSRRELLKRLQGTPTTAVPETIGPSGGVGVRVERSSSPSRQSEE